MSVERVAVEAPVARVHRKAGRESCARCASARTGRRRRRHSGRSPARARWRPSSATWPTRAPRGAAVLLGGARHDAGPGIFYQPTVIAGVDHSMLIMQEETFGPVVPVMVVADAEEAVRLANESRYGLNASVWTRDLDRGLALAGRIESGSVCVNDCLVSAGCIDLPFGGVKQSGVGTRHGGAEGLRQFCVAQATLSSRGRRRRSEPNWFPYSVRKARLLSGRWGFCSAETRAALPGHRPRTSRPGRSDAARLGSGRLPGWGRFPHVRLVLLR